MMAGRQAGGPETYECSLIRALAKLDTSNEYHVFCLGPESRDAIGVEQDNLHYHVMWPRTRWISLPIVLPLSLRRHRLDFYHATFVPPPISPLPYVFTMHDVTPIAHPHFYPPRIQKRLAALIRRGVKRSRLIICVSQNALDTTAEWFGVSPDRMAVVHHGVDSQYRPVPTAEAGDKLRHYGIDRPYVLFVGKLEWFK
ncbi:MAG: glycosyltransferase, partial [Planctomycetes bacterium]|nr:glycosyltransferase [Planctomycetota bacterium]